MKTKELRESTVDELKARKREMSQEALNLRIQQQSGQLENPSRLKHLRKDVARIETVISERRVGIIVTPTAQKKVTAVTKSAVKKASAKKATAKKAAKATAIKE